VLNNCKQFLADDYNIFLVSNDKFNLYPTIAENAGMKILNQFNQPVLNRTEKDKEFAMAAYGKILWRFPSGRAFRCNIFPTAQFQRSEKDFRFNP
jgi:hypothetical protein